MDITNGQFKLKATPNDAKLECVQEKEDLILANARSLYDRFYMFPDFSWRKHMNNNITCGGMPKKIERE